MTVQRLNFNQLKYISPINKEKCIKTRTQIRIWAPGVAHLEEQDIILSKSNEKIKNSKWVIKF